MDQPLDPFAGDPHDPVAEFAALEGDDGAEEEARPLSLTEREEVLADLVDLEMFQQLLTPRGIRGLLVDCDSCDEPHFFGWELLRGNLQHLLDVGETRVHEPAFAPDPSDYVTWEYARGYADAILEAADDD